MNDLRARLQTAVGSAYRIDKELGGGGMSRVFVAEESALGRRVVIKVLPPDLAAGVNVERFRREIQLAASLQHPHVVQLLTAGAADNLLYYVMPFIPGESLRAKLAREGELPVPEVVRILRDVVDALSYAHAQGVVHRDIKPDNVLITGKHAVVTDFGVAKAVSASSGQSTLTSLGVALGTPAYMAPEQAAADPHVDHRADLYAVGVLAYEMLCGKLPFNAATPQAMLAAHVNVAPEPVTLNRQAVPAALSELVMRCLEKHPADRWQRADDVLAQLEAMATPSGGMPPTATGPVSAAQVDAALRQSHPVRVAALFAAASLAVLGFVYVLVWKLGLPDWVFAGAVGLLLVGLPIMLMTGLAERRRMLASTGRLPAAAASGASAWHGWLTWRKAIGGGVAAFVALALTAAVYTAMRLFGIGPVGTLVASGVLRNRETLILADFENRTTDSTLGPSLTEAFRVDLTQSPTVRLADAQTLAEALGRMQRKANAHVDAALARDVAVREGIKAVATGQIDPVGRGFVLSASLVSATDGHVLTAVRETADDDRALIGAIDRLSRKLRERIGESLTTIRANQPLEKVTTGSLEALRKYTQAIAAEDAGDFDGAIALLEEATTLDTGFAMAYRKLGVVLDNSGTSITRANAAVTKAFEHRDRLPEIERHQTIAYYYFDVDYDLTKVIAAYRSVLERDPDNTIALNNLAFALNDSHRWAEAESLALRATTIEQSPPYFVNAVVAQVAQGHFADVRATLDRFDHALPRSPGRLVLRARAAFAERDYEAAQQAARRLREETQNNLVFKARSSQLLGAIAETQGQLAAAERHARDFMTESEQRGVLKDYLAGATTAALVELRYRARPAEALRQVEGALQRHPLASLPPLDRPYALLAWFYAQAGRPEQARRLLSEYVANVPQGVRRGEPLRFDLAATGAIAVGEGRSQDAAAAFRGWSQEPGECLTCGLFELATVYDRAHQPDSALAIYERVVNTPSLPYIARYAIAPTYKRLGELYEERGDRAKAREYYGRFVDLWKDADPELQPVVRDVRARMTRLVEDRPR
ncbi:MAG: hypothetical protein AUH06_10445 [Gemmatimonadetes bacterium 13_2_20CM_69_27]|nr:MAG: hypothetical protein AUH06_10445 [Gemmatimonadetes bacterium 13_2_20CM_69_27]